jgi:hypothetical protein
MPFASYFREAMDDCANAISDTMGETVTVFPYTAKPNFPSMPDPSLLPFSITAVFTHKAVMAFSKKGEPASGNREFDLAPLISTRKPCFSVKACELPFPLRQHYRIERCWNKAVWEITDIKSDGISRIECDVVQLGRASQLDRPAR